MENATSARAGCGSVSTAQCSFSQSRVVEDGAIVCILRPKTKGLPSHLSLTSSSLASSSLEATQSSSSSSITPPPARSAEGPAAAAAGAL